MGTPGSAVGRGGERSVEMGRGRMWDDCLWCDLRGMAARGGDDSAKAGRRETGLSPAFIDRLIEEAWKTAGVKPAKPASDEEFLRRVYVDLLGRIPNVQEARAFLATREPDKRPKLIEYLLEHPDFAKNFAHAMDNLAHRPRQQGPDGRPGALSSWLRKQFSSDRPWNEVVHELVSATGSNKENGAVNYVAGAPGIRRCPSDIADDPSVPRPADTVHAVP